MLENNTTDPIIKVIGQYIHETQERFIKFIRLCEEECVFLTAVH